MCFFVRVQSIMKPALCLFCLWSAWLWRHLFAMCVLSIVSMTVRWALCYVCFVYGQHDSDSPSLCAFCLWSAWLRSALCYVFCHWSAWLWDEPFAMCVLSTISMTVRWALCYVCFVTWSAWLWDEPFAMCVLSVVSMIVKWALCYHCTRPLLCAACVLMSVKHNIEIVKPAFCYVSFVVCEAWSTSFAVCFVVFGACLCGLLTVAWLQSLLTSTYPEHFWWPWWPQGHRMSQK